MMCITLHEHQDHNIIFSWLFPSQRNLKETVPEEFEEAGIVKTPGLCFHLLKHCTGGMDQMWLFWNSGVYQSSQLQQETQKANPLILGISACSIVAAPLSLALSSAWTDSFQDLRLAWTTYSKFWWSLPGFLVAASHRRGVDKEIDDYS